MESPQISDALRHLTLLQLPGELLELVVNTVYQNGRERALCVIPLSCTCQVLRRTCMRLLFGTRRIRLRDGHVDDFSRQFLKLMLDPMSNVAGHILHLNVEDSTRAFDLYSKAVSRGCGDSVTDLTRSVCIELIRKALSVMTNLQTVRYVQPLNSLRCVLPDELS